MPETESPPDVRIRKARVQDATAIVKLVNSYADRELLLPRSLGETYEAIRDFLVAENASGEIVGCCALQPFWEDLAEIRSLAVREDFAGRGLGRGFVQRGLEEAKELGIKRVFALTYIVGYFVRLGFRPIDKSKLPHKIWAICTKCSKFPDCGEEAVICEVPD